MHIDLNDKATRCLVQEYVNKICYFSSEKELYYNLHKLIHTFDVVDMAQNLIKMTKPALSPAVKKHILNAAVLHDLGRCYEFKNGYRLKIDHGKKGADLIKKYLPDMKIEMQSTLLHNKLPSDQDPKSCQPVLDYVRDADMLANIKYEILHTDTWLKHIVVEVSSKKLTPKIDEEVIQAWLQKRPAYLKKIKVRNLLTLWLWQLCWYYNLRTPAGIKLARKEKLFPRLREKICKKIIPLTTQDKNLQKILIQRVQKTFPNKTFM